MPKNCLKFPVEHVREVFGESKVLAERLEGRKVLLVADWNVVHHIEGIGTRIGAYVKAHNITLAGAPIVLSGGERAKMDGFQGPNKIVAALQAGQLGSEDVVLVLGGGAILDVAGWTAAQWHGGVPIVRVPTTPATMMGSAFGEVAAINSSRLKDAFSVVSIPEMVVIDTALASTVLVGVWSAGIAEAVRLVAEKDPKQLCKVAEEVDRYAKRESEALDTLVDLTLTIRQKKGCSSLGLKTAGELEMRSNWKMPHGYGVALGLIIELHEQVKAGNYKEAHLLEVRDILRKAGALEAARYAKHILPPELADFW